jgi:CheY-like chemotaxis protein
MATKRILIADDDHEVLQLLSIMAIKEGYVVSGVKDGIDLLSTFEKEKFDLIITDLLIGKPKRSISNRNFKNAGKYRACRCLNWTDTPRDSVC